MVKTSPAAPRGPVVDLLVIGGGANGCGIARDAAGRGLSVTLCEQGDLAGATSSASSKLIHGGLRYLETFDVGLVREALREREILLAVAPHIVRPLSFLLPHQPGLRPWWMLRAGLFLYDRLGGGRTLPRTAAVSLRTGPLKARFERGFAYADARVDDARLVALVALDAAERGAAILTRTRLISAAREGDAWRACVQRPDGSTTTLYARALVNAAGPWVTEVARRIDAQAPRARVKLVKGSHIVVPRLYAGDHAYTLQGPDGRVIFTIPYEGRFTLVGTTDIPLGELPADLSCSQGEDAYLLETLAGYFDHALTPADVIWRYAGVRALQDDGRSASAATRDYVIEMDAGGEGAPLVTVIGGKLTTFRRLSESVLERLKPALGFAAGPWTSRAILPGGDLGAGFGDFVQEMETRYPWAPGPMLARLCGAYGSRVVRVLDPARSLADLGAHFGATLFQKEVDYLREVEWAVMADDVLWRRTKLGLHMTDGERAAFAGGFAPAQASSA